QGQRRPDGGIRPAERGGPHDRADHPRGGRRGARQARDPGAGRPHRGRPAGRRPRRPATAVQPAAGGVVSPTEVIRFALAGLAANKVRSGLTMLGVLIGVASVILLLAVGNGSAPSGQNSISSLGAHAPTRLHPEGAAAGATASTSASGVTSYAEPQNLTVQDATALAAASGVASASPVVSTSETLSNNGTSDTDVSLSGTYPTSLQAEDDTLSAGAAFTTQQVSNAQDVVIIGSEVAT